MADYWKSQDRKYCDFCKCWIADNKPSVEFHEKGRRHQENVKRRLRTITKNSERAHRESERVDATIKKMEAAAMEAYRKDVENNTDLTAKAINKRLEEDNLAISSGSKKLWHETRSKDGRIYYWNVMTNETVWEAPSEGYLSLAEQKALSDQEAAKQLQAVDKYRKKEALIITQKQKQEDEEERARLAREKLKERRVKEDTPEPVYGPIIEPEKTDAYGGWTTVKESAPLDLQLPVQPEPYYEQEVPEYEPEPVVKEFKEKAVESLAKEGGESSFKKRKINAGAKRNTRQRLDDD